STQRSILEMLHKISVNNNRLKKKINKLSKPKVQSESKKILTLEDIQKVLKISEPTAFRFIREGKIPSRKIGSRYYFYEKDIHSVLEQNYKNLSPKGKKK